MIQIENRERTIGTLVHSGNKYRTCLHLESTPDYTIDASDTVVDAAFGLNLGSATGDVLLYIAVRETTPYIFCVQENGCNVWKD